MASMTAKSMGGITVSLANKEAQTATLETLALSRKAGENPKVDVRNTPALT